jgi:hypothetical protein
MVQPNRCEITITAMEKDYFTHPTAIVEEGAKIGAGTKIWCFSHIMEGAVLGEKCSIGQNVVIGPGVILGKNCKLQNHISTGTGLELADDVFVGPLVGFTNVVNPRSEVNRRGQYLRTYVGKGVSIGANAVILCGIEIGEYAFIGAGAAVTKSVIPYALMVGNPARQIGWMSRAGGRLNFDGKGEATCPENGERYRLVDGRVEYLGK